ncbi:MAG: hypothetical protein AB7O62_06045 [Pirellulales bacterium]
MFRNLAPASTATAALSIIADHPLDFQPLPVETPCETGLELIA